MLLIPPSNGITMCTGSLGAGSFNNCPLIAKTLAHRINFTHLRNVKRDETGNFHEDFVFNGDVDLYEVMKTLVLEEEKRKKEGRKDWQIPMRPDHGNLMLGDIGRQILSRLFALWTYERIGRIERVGSRHT